MIIAVYSRIKIDQLLKKLTWSFAIAAGAVFLFWLVARFFFSWQTGQEMVISTPSILAGSSTEGVSYQAIGTGPVSLKRPLFSPLIAQLKEEVLVLAQNTRPDADKAAAAVLIQLKSSGLQRALSAETPAYLEEVEGELSFASEVTNFSIRPLYAESGDLFLEGWKEGQKAQILISPSGALKHKKEEGASYLGALRSAHYWGQDLLIQHYSGPEHAHLKDKYKLIIGPSVLFLAQGDCLQWNGANWEASSFGLQSRQAPLAEVRSVSMRGIELDVWSPSGFERVAVKVDLSQPAKVGSTFDLIPSSVRLRTLSQVTCALGKRRLILKEGDWLLRGGSGWRKLRTPLEIEDLLFHRLSGDLLIFDGIEKQQSKMLLQAHLFDEMRVQMQTVAIPIFAEKKKTSGGK